MELRLTQVIDILKTIKGARIEQGQDGYATGVNSCINLLTKISEVEGGRMVFEISQDEPTELVLKVPNQHVETFKLCTEVAVESKRDCLEGIYMTWRGSFKEDKS